ncbi:MAG: 4a-hydroxytetrahydrobiopterin dehydratase [Acidimicrobiia bacterium]|nr:4a-hydroxytetrahydrobiopterin dehydratase [Acidimicrobiia bacterium]
MTERLPPGEIAAGLARLSGWALIDAEIRKDFVLGTFPEAISFVVSVGYLAEAANHHPDIDVRWRTVTIALTTHDAGGLTQLDLDLAQQIESLPR